ncbi:MAG: DUF4920 domain-containing protein [Bacteroidales bacterium]
MVKNIILLFAISFLFGCNYTSTTEQTETADNTEISADTTGFYGEKISGENPISGNELKTMLESNDSVWVTMKSTIVTNCQHSGCWMDLDLGTGEVVKVTFKDYSFFIPLDSKGKTATVEGFAKKEMIPVDMLQHYAEDDGKSAEEIAAITEPELAYTFEAIGVIIED